MNDLTNVLINLCHVFNREHDHFCSFSNAQKEEERLKASIRRESQQRRVRERAHQRGVNTNYLEGDYEEEEDDNEISLANIKKQFKPGAKRRKDKKTHLD